MKAIAAPVSAPMATKAAAIGKMVIGPPGQIVPASVAIRMPSKPELGADPAQHGLARHQHGDEGRDQAGRQHLGQDVDEQVEIAEQDFQKPRLAVAPIDDRPPRRRPRPRWWPIDQSKVLRGRRLMGASEDKAASKPLAQPRAIRDCRVRASRQRRGDPGARGDAGEIARGDGRRRRDPGAADREHIRQREIGRGVVAVDAAGRAEPDVRQRLGHGLEPARAARRLGRKEFQHRKAERGERHRLGHGGAAGQRRHRRIGQRLRELGRRAGADQKIGAGIDGMGDVERLGHGADRRRSCRAPRR